VLILATKLHIPPHRPQAVIRTRLIERLNQGLGRKLTLVSAPAGFGKTTLLTEWIAGCQRPASWFSIDEGDNDPARFWSHLIAALRTLAPDVGAEGMTALQSNQPPRIESVLTSLLNEIESIVEDFILVLDDYHALVSQQIDSALTFLVERVPPHMHLVIATREDPNLPLARLRARGQLVEVRVQDLRFTISEASEFLDQTMGLHLSIEDVAALDNRTEGWVAGLQLAALSMQGLQDTADFIQSFSGTHRFVLDYLLEEVLQRQSEGIQTFLLQTSILDRMCGQLCDAVLVNPSISSQETLEHLERANLFIISLDNDRNWYRYHHLFAELLRSRLVRLSPDRVEELHRRASDWCALNDLPTEAVTHALAIEDWSRAADIIERFSDSWPMRGEIHILLRWLESFPSHIRLERPRLGLAYAWALFMANRLDRAEQFLNQLMPLVQTLPHLLGEVFTIRVMIAAHRDDLPAVMELSRHALAVVPPEEVSPRSRILLSLGAAHDEIGGDIAAEKRIFREAYELGTAATPANAVGNAPLPLTALAYLADIELLQGNLHEASRRYEQALELAEQWGGQSSIAYSLLHRGRGELLYEWNDLDGARHALQESIRIGELWKNRRLLVHSYGLLAKVMRARGQADDARAMVQRAEQITREHYSSPPDLGSLAVGQIAFWTAQNDFEAIERWEQEHDSAWRSKIGRVRDVLAIVLARARIARYHWKHDQYALSQARTLIEPALEQAQANGLLYNATRLNILRALALYAQRETVSAITVLKRALEPAETGNYVRSFLDIGEPMQEFLLWSLESQSLSEPHLRSYVGTLLSTFGKGHWIESMRPGGQATTEPLSQRELEVLTLVARGLSNREIGERLFLALSTVKGHVRVIFDKLGVHRRTEALARARELGLL